MIKSFIKAFRGTNADKATVARLRKAEQLFAKALDNEIDLSDIRRIIYDGENNGISAQDSELLQIYTSRTYSYNDFVRKISQNKRDSSNKPNRRGSSGKTQFS